MRTILITILAALLIASAQQVATQPPAAQQKSAAKSGAPQKKGTASAPGAKKVYSFTDTVQLVVVDVFAKDKNGNPVPDMKAADFAITEDGKPQIIKVCEYQELQTAPVTEAPPTPTALAARPEAAAPLPPVAAEVKAVTANQITPAKAGEVKYKDRRLMVMFFDMTSMPIQDQIRAQDSAVKFIKSQITASDLVAIMTFSAGRQSGGRFHRRPRQARQGHQGPDRRRRPVSTSPTPAMLPPIPARPSPPTIPNSIFSTPTASCPLWRPLPRCSARCRKRRPWSTSPAA
jgi:hypothetical protein